LWDILGRSRLGIHVSADIKQQKMTRIQKHAGHSMAEQLPKQMAKILYGTLIQETLRSNDENRMKSVEQSQQCQNNSIEDELLKVVKPEENSTWRIALHKRTVK